MRAQSSLEVEFAHAQAARSRRSGERGGAAAVSAGPQPPGALLALQCSIGNAAVAAVIARSRHEHGPGCGPADSGGAVGAGAGVGVVQRSKKKDWKLGSTSNELAAVKTAHSSDPLVDTLHHIIPKSFFQPFLAVLTPAQERQIGTTPAPLAPKAFGTSDVDKALKNMPANFRVGPRPEDRTDGPGDGLDLTEDAKGNTTPRSAELENAFKYRSVSTSSRNAACWRCCPRTSTTPASTGCRWWPATGGSPFGSATTRCRRSPSA
ncbi:hypothetical protein [Streptomyces sp. Ncost-T10-10d]|uniref:hypothetical protein n=1 Tax=Streptomyces sp. Ncost-T10-10d TaxID=1839774 RepID=UPI00081D47E9|nr:hypothetical protein [Streptomyces sp. Ncost-T10-10d]SCF97321.1 hypothetical protein GA0115254_1284113 [Streptomyces sp. Ncost-T10-10d]